MSAKRFRIAFSFAGEKRDFVAEVAAILAGRFGEDKILYDKYHEAEFARRDLGIYLPDLYHDQSDLVVVVVCPNYDEREWTGLEWVAIHDLLKSCSADSSMRKSKAFTLTPVGSIWIAKLPNEPPGSSLNASRSMKANRRTTTVPTARHQLRLPPLPSPTTFRAFSTFSGVRMS